MPNTCSILQKYVMDRKAFLPMGYWTAQVLGVERDQLIPLYGHLYSAEAPEFRSENHEIFKAIKFVSHFCKNQGTWVIDRGGDRMALFGHFLDNQQNFIVRLQQNRHLLKGQKSMIKQDVLTLAKSCPIHEERKIIRQKDGQGQIITLRYGKRCVRLPERPEKPLWLVVVHGLWRKTSYDPHHKESKCLGDFGDLSDEMENRGNYSLCKASL